MTCAQAKSMFSAYLDGAVTGRQMLSLGRHLKVAARADSSIIRTAHYPATAGKHGPRQSPGGFVAEASPCDFPRSGPQASADISAICSSAWRTLSRLHGPATAGVLATVAIFALLMGFITPVQADNSDVPLLISTKPELQQTGFGMTLGGLPKTLW